MGRAPCCEKMGLKKGPWTPEEDQILITYIRQHGHGNWRALPKHAGLLRCGKSCRLRWTNYLRPDIKRGNFSREEEETIIKLHELLGNRWSTIAARLPGRTDNEIKNVWHTHLKKRLIKNQTTPENKQQSNNIPQCDTNLDEASEPVNFLSESGPNNWGFMLSPKQASNCDLSSSTDCSVVTTGSSSSSSSSNNMDPKEENTESPEIFPDIDESFWLETLSMENSGIPRDFPAIRTDPELQFPSSQVFTTEPIYGYGCDIDSNMDFWKNLFVKAEEELQELLDCRRVD